MSAAAWLSIAVGILVVLPFIAAAILVWTERADGSQWRSH